MPFTALQIAAFAPMAIASVSVAVVAKPGARPNTRRA
jgi:hypothetical protein